MRLPALALAALCCLVHFEVMAADAIDFARPPDDSNVKLSPDGTYVGVVGDVDGQAGLTIYRLADKQITGRFGLGPHGAIEDYWWVGPNRLVVSTAIEFGSLDTPRPIGELIGVDADGGHRTYLLGFRAPIGPIGPAGNRGFGYNFRDTIDIATMINPLSWDPQHALISVHVLGGSHSVEYDTARAYLLDVQTGARSVVATAPIRGPGSFLADRAGNVRFFVGNDDKGRVKTYVRPTPEAPWQLINSGALEHVVVDPLAFGTANTVFLTSNEKSGRACLYQQDLASGEKTELSCDDTSDLVAAVMSSDLTHPVAAIYSAGKPEFHYLGDRSDPDRLLIEKIQNAFPGEVVYPTSRSLDGQLWILYAFSDRNPGRYFTFDRRTEKASFLLSASRWVDPKTMGERRPISYTARDGATIHAYLSLPPGRAETNLPLVVLPHGGPFGIRDDWAWDSEVQWLATHGYAVLQPNFRGSGGYGTDFEEAAKRSWDKLMIDDITDGTRWALQSGIADPARVAIYGASYGGYAALMSTLREPGLYRCVIDYAGVTDLKRWRRDSDASNTSAGRAVIDEFIGADDASLTAASPLTIIDRLSVPILIVHGKEDVRVPYSQATALRKALDQRKLPYEWLVKDGEGHGFTKLENRAELLEKLVSFLDRNLPASAPSPSPSPSP